MIAPKRLSIRTMMVFIAVLAFCIAAMARQSRLMASIVFGVTLALLAYAMIESLLSRGKNRAWWVGFLVCGIFSLATHFTPLFSVVAGRYLLEGSGSTPPYLPTTAILDAVYPKIHDPDRKSQGFLPIINVTGGQSGTPSLSNKRYFAPIPATAEQYSDYWHSRDSGGMMYAPARSPTFLSIGYCLFTLIAALAGGYAAV